MEAVEEWEAMGLERQVDSQLLRSRLSKAGMARLTQEQRRALASRGGKSRWRKTRKPAGKMRPIEVDDRGRVRSFPSITAAAKGMKVSRGTVYRWIANAEESREQTLSQAGLELEQTLNQAGQQFL